MDLDCIKQKFMSGILNNTFCKWTHFIDITQLIQIGIEVLETKIA